MKISGTINQETVHLMKSKIFMKIFLVFAINSLVVIASASPPPFLEGVTFDSSGNNTIAPFYASSSRQSLEFDSFSGGLVFYSCLEETSPGSLNGGITLYGSPISLILASDSGSVFNKSSFNVWRGSSWGNGAPLFRIDALTGQSTFTGSNVSINSGTLSVAGSPVLTSGTAAQIIGSQGFIQESNLTTALNSAVPPTSAPWAAAFVARGNVTNGAYFAHGDLASASGLDSTAIGYYSTASGIHSTANGHGPIASGDFATAIGNGTIASGSYSSAAGVGSTATAENATAIGYGTLASGYQSSAAGVGSISSGQYSVATGYYSTASMSYSMASGALSTASGIHSMASGNRATASGYWSTARGNNVAATSSTETVFGRYNRVSTPESPVAWSGLDGIFRVGNGSFGIPSDALTILKNGQATLTNQDWKAATVASPGNLVVALADPASTTDSGGEALVVEGHTRLKGKVIIEQPQGDISMGDYQ